MAQPGIRATQIADLIRDILAPAIQRDNAGLFVSVQQVTLTADLKRATVWISVFPIEKQEIVVRNLLKKNRTYYQIIRQKLQRHTLPTLSFASDTSFEDQTHIDELLK